MALGPVTLFLQGDAVDHTAPGLDLQGAIAAQVGVEVLADETGEIAHQKMGDVIRVLEVEIHGHVAAAAEVEVGGGDQECAIGWNLAPPQGHCFLDMAGVVVDVADDHVGQTIQALTGETVELDVLRRVIRYGRAALVVDADLVDRNGSRRRSRQQD